MFLKWGSESRCILYTDKNACSDFWRGENKLKEAREKNQLQTYEIANGNFQSGDSVRDR